jgi:serine/threonine protein kinase
MYRLIEEMNAKGEQEKKVCGVLTDYDLSSWTASLNPDYTKTSQQRTGTPPYMAQELLTGTSPLHLYRHDVESLFHIMLLMLARHTIGTPKGEKKPRVLMREDELPYQDWFNEPRYYVLGLLKEAFFLKNQPITLSPLFVDFLPWLRDLRSSFKEGFKAKLSYPNTQEELPEWRRRRAGGSAGEVNPAPVPFDDETLGGHVGYSDIIEPTRYLEGELEGLVIRYNSPPPPSLQTSTSAGQAGA